MLYGIFSLNAIEILTFSHIYP